MADPHCREEDRDRRRRERVERCEARRARDHARVVRPGCLVRPALLHEHDGPPGRDLGGRDADGLEPVRLQVAADLAPRDRAHHDALEVLAVQEAVEAIRRCVAAERGRRAQQAEHAARQAKHLAHRRAEELLQRQALPHAREQGPALLAQVRRRRDEAGVDGADRGPTHDVDARRVPEPVRQRLEQEAQHAGLVGAAGAAAREHERAPRPSRLRVEQRGGGHRGSLSVRAAGGPGALRGPARMRVALVQLATEAGNLERNARAIAAGIEATREATKNRAPPSA